MPGFSDYCQVLDKLETLSVHLLAPVFVDALMQEHDRLRAVRTRSKLANLLCIFVNAGFHWHVLGDQQASPASYSSHINTLGCMRQTSAWQSMAGHLQASLGGVALRLGVGLAIDGASACQQLAQPTCSCCPTGPEDGPPVVLVHGFGASAYHW